MKQQQLNSYSITFVFSLLILVLSSCANKQLSYTVDPELNSIDQFAKKSSLIAVSVIDKRTNSPLINNAEIKVISPQKSEALTLRKKILDSLKQKNYKIISNKLLADISLELEIIEFQVTVQSELFKSKLRVSSQLKIRANKQGHTFEKLYKMSRSQEVANPVNSNDLSGIVNQVLSKQFSDIWLDPALSQITSS